MTPPQDHSEHSITEHRFTCETCGSNCHFDPEHGNLYCVHCGQREHISSPPAHHQHTLSELNFTQAIKDSLNAPQSAISQENGYVVHCPNCGADTEFDADVRASKCPFCATSVVTQASKDTQIKPRGLAPFVLSKSAANASLQEWFGTLWFAPSNLQDTAKHGRHLNGVYVPYWTFDAQTQSSYSGSRGTHYYVSKRMQIDGKTVTTQVRKTRWRSVSGRVARFFDDVLVLASKNLPETYTNNLAPWDLSKLEPYQPAYLAGFQAQAYQVDLEEGFQIARKDMDRMIIRDVKYDIGGDTQRIHSVNTDVQNITFKHILLPIWISAYKYRGQTYQIVINAQTGRVQGRRPFSIWKIVGAVLMSIALIAGITAISILKQQGAF